MIKKLYCLVLMAFVGSSEAALKQLETFADALSSLAHTLGPQGTKSALAGDDAKHCPNFLKQIANTPKGLMDLPGDTTDWKKAEEAATEKYLDIYEALYHKKAHIFQLTNKQAERLVQLSKIFKTNRGWFISQMGLKDSTLDKVIGKLYSVKKVPNILDVDVLLICVSQDPVLKPVIEWLQANISAKNPQFLKTSNTAPRDGLEMLLADKAYTVKAHNFDEFHHAACAGGKLFRLTDPAVGLAGLLLSDRCITGIKGFYSVGAPTYLVLSDFDNDMDNVHEYRCFWKNRLVAVSSYHKQDPLFGKTLKLDDPFVQNVIMHVKKFFEDPVFAKLLKQHFPAGDAVVDLLLVPHGTDKFTVKFIEINEYTENTSGQLYDYENDAHDKAIWQGTKFPHTTDARISEYYKAEAFKTCAQLGVH